MELVFANRCHVGSHRKTNQDVTLAMPGEGVFLVADGMGGEQAGDEAAAQVASAVRDTIRAYFQGAPASPRELNNKLIESLDEAHSRIEGVVEREPAKRGMGSTASLLCLHRGIYSIAQTGDSRVYLCRNGVVRQLTRDHTMVWQLYEQGLITRAMLETHPERHLLTQCVGGSQSFCADTFQGLVAPGDLFLICSDGLTGYAGEPVIFDYMADPGMDVEEMADCLIKAALRGGGGDNISVLLVRALATGSGDDWSAEYELCDTRTSEGTNTLESSLSGAEDPAGRATLIGALIENKLLVGVAAIAAAVVLILILIYFGPQPHS